MSALLGELRRTQVGCSVMDFAVLLVVTSYFLLFGLVPYFGGDRLGLVGADEPRYAQIAREMLAAHSEDCHEVNAKIMPHSLRPKAIHASYECLVGGTVTPILYGRPWLEKPALYYWRAMGFFKEFGVSDWSARLPSALTPADTRMSPMPSIVVPSPTPIASWTVLVLAPAAAPIAARP